MEQQTKKKPAAKVIILIVVVAALALGMFAVYKTFTPKGEAGDKRVTVTVVHGDQSKKTFTFQTDEAYLRAVLEEADLVEGEDNRYGIFITSVDGEAADDSKQQWWCITKAGKKVNYSADQTPVADGDAFELTLKEGY